MADRIIARVLPPKVRDSEGTLHRPVILSFIVACLCLVVITALILGSFAYGQLGETPEEVRIVLIVLGAEFGLALLAVLALMIGWFDIGRLALMLFGLAVYLSVGLALGPDSGADLIGGVALVALPFLLFHATERVKIAVTLIPVLFAVIGLQAYSWDNPPLLWIPEAEMQLNRFAAIVISVLIGGFIAYLHVTAEAAKQALATEKQRSEDLLLNILPAEIAERLKDGETGIADRYDSVSVLFADIVGFTAFSSVTPPEKVVAMLNQIYKGIDLLAARYGVEKIKTMGDGYMAAAGVPKRMEARQATLATAALALEMQDFVATIRERTGSQLQFRIGIHTGSAVAGIIGQHKFSYDLWGDTVNVASRMESNGAPGRVNVSEDVYRLLYADYAFEARGSIAVKGKGALNCYFLDRAATTRAA